MFCDSFHSLDVLLQLRSLPCENMVALPSVQSLESVLHPTWATDVFRPAVRLAGERGVTICLEPLPAEDTNFINTAAEAIRFTRQLASPNFQVILDVRAMSAESIQIPQIIRESRGEFAYVHANDANLKGPGFGDVDFRPIATALREVGYDGTVSVEVFKFDEGAEAIASQSLEYLRRVFG